MDKFPVKTYLFETPLKQIAVTFSGGGFRAAAFSLGTLSYLRNIKTLIGNSAVEHPLLDNLCYISSTSGGSFTNALYASYIHKGKSFEACYEKLLSVLSGEDLLQQVFSVLNDDQQWKQKGQCKNRNLINAFAKVYDNYLFEGETFGVFWDKTIIPKFEVCFNATEFYRGLSFRFQTEGLNNKKEVIGNKFLHFNTAQLDVLKQIKLADMVAASSCFPMGFEPIVYPEDFTYNDKNKNLDISVLKTAMLAENYTDDALPLEKPFGLMDGGITDNQGLYSAMQADKKRRKRKDGSPFDLIIITDVTSYFMHAYQEPQERKGKGWRKRNVNNYIKKGKSILNKINWFTLIVTIFLLGSIVAISCGVNTILNNICFTVIGITTTLLVLIILLKSNTVLKKLFKDKDIFDVKDLFKNAFHLNNYFSDEIIVKMIRFFSFTKLGVFEQMIKARMASMMSMLLDINLKQVRRLIYEIFYNDPMWENRRLPNFIYEFSTYNIASRADRFNNAGRLTWAPTEDDKTLFLQGFEKINAVAEDARLMGTTLWFDETDVKDDTLKKIIATGQFTTCGNLLEYIISLERKGLVFDGIVQAQLSTLKESLLIDFKKFKANPYYLYESI